MIRVSNETQMDRAARAGWRRRHLACFCIWFSLCAISLFGTKERTGRVNLFPRLRAGQTLTYQIAYHSDKRVKTESNVSAAAPGNASKLDTSALLRLKVLGVRATDARAVIQARATVEIFDTDARYQIPNGESSNPKVEEPVSAGKFVEFTILSDGRLDQVNGLSAFLPAQQQAWREWADRFLLAAALPAGAVLTQKWTSEVWETSPSPIAGLRWTRESTYVGDEPCHAVVLTERGDATAGDAEAGMCAVILTNATLKQDSKVKNATPKDFKLHDLRTTGSAGGSNRIITFVSLETGILIRATEEAVQQMDVTVAKADGSNRVHYNVDAKSHSAVVMVSDIGLKNPR